MLSSSAMALNLSEATAKAPQYYIKLSDEKQAEFQKLVVERLGTLIGGYTELNVLAEYIAVMLQSARPAEQIQSELDAFLQEQGGPFTTWLCERLTEFATAAGATGNSPPAEGAAAPAAPEATGEKDAAEAVTSRAAKETRSSRSSKKDVSAAADANDAEVAATASKRKNGKSEKEKASRKTSRNRVGTSAASNPPVLIPAAVSGGAPSGAGGPTLASLPGAAAAAPAAGGERHRSRSRQRRRRTSRRTDSDRKAVLTPNVQFLKDAYHQKASAAEKEAPNQPGPPPDDPWWQFRAETPGGAASTRSSGPPGPGPVPAAGPPAGPPAAGPYQHAPYPPPGYGMPTVAAPPATHMAPPRHFTIKKWLVVRSNTVVRATEHLNSEEVRTLQEGEIVEQVAPIIKLANGIVRIQIRHPSSMQFPNPIGWVTQDATAAGGPKFLEPGPEPMGRPQHAKPAASSSGAPHWGAPNWPRPPRHPGGFRPGGVAPVRGPSGFQNLTWTPGGDAAAPPA